MKGSLFVTCWPFEYCLKSRRSPGTQSDKLTHEHELEEAHLTTRQLSRFAETASMGTGLLTEISSRRTSPRVHVTG